MTVLRLIGFAVLLGTIVDLRKAYAGQLKCNDTQYGDEVTNICMPCNACCPPRPDNQFCRKGCNLDSICKGSPTKLETRYIIVVAILPCLIVLTILIIVLVLKRRWIRSALQRLCSRKSVQEANVEHRTQTLVINCEEMPQSSNSNKTQREPQTAKQSPTVFKSFPGRHSAFHSIPSSGNDRQTGGNVPNSSLPPKLPPYLERNGVRFIREDIVESYQDSILPLLDTDPDSRDGEPSSSPLDRLQRSPAKADAEASSKPLVSLAVQCTEDLGCEEESRGSSPMETEVKKFVWNDT